MSFIALLDANVLWPAALRCLLVRAAIAQLYRPVWTQQILDEMADSLIREGRATQDRIDRTVRLMLDHVPHALVDGYEPLIPAMACDPGDRHVLAAAVRANVGTIVTFNGKHFPAASRESYHIAIHTPDEFLLDLWDLSSDTMARILREQAAELRDPPMSARQVVEAMRGIVPRFAKTVLESGLSDDEDFERAASIQERSEAYL